MREIKFRIRGRDGRWWRFGVYAGKPNVATDPRTLGEYTGLKDKNGVEIYEGDILEYRPDGYDPDEPWDRYVVEWRDRGFVGVWERDRSVKNRDNDGLNDAHIDIVVIGNIDENPELLEGGDRQEAQR